QPPADLASHVDADLVQQDEGAHWHSEILKEPVYCNEVASLLDQPDALVEVWHEEPVDEKARAVVDDDRRFAQGKDGTHGVRNGLGTGARSWHHLHEGHAVGRVEEVHANE